MTTPTKAYGIQKLLGRQAVVTDTAGGAWPQHKMSKEDAQGLADELNTNLGWEDLEQAKLFFEANRKVMIF